MSGNQQTLDDVAASGWRPDRESWADRSHVLVLGERGRWHFGDEIERLDIRFYDLIVREPGKPMRILERQLFRSIQDPEYDTPEDLRAMLLGALEDYEARPVTSLSAYRQDYRDQWSTEGYEVPPEAIFGRPEVEIAFEGLVNMELLLDRMIAADSPFSEDVRQGFSELWWVSKVVDRAVMKRRVGPALKRRKEVAEKNRINAKEGRGKQQTAQKLDWERKCWAWIVRDLGPDATDPGLISNATIFAFVINDWDDRPFEGGPPRDGKVGGPPSDRLLRTRLPSWRAWGAASQRR